MVGVGIAYMIFGNKLVDPSCQDVAADKQDRVSRAILGTQVRSLVLFKALLICTHLCCWYCSRSGLLHFP